MVMINLRSMVGPYKRQFLTADFWDSVFVKLVATFISVKVWALFSILTIPTVLLSKGLIDGGEWTTTVTTCFATIIGVREIYKIASVRQYSDNPSRQDQPDNDPR